MTTCSARRSNASGASVTRRRPSGTWEEKNEISASLYNASGDKRALNQRALDYCERESLAGHIRCCEELVPRAAIGELFAEIKAGRPDGTMTRSFSAEGLAHHLLGVLIVVSVLAHVRPERVLLEGFGLPALAPLERSDFQTVIK